MNNSPVFEQSRTNNPKVGYETGLIRQYKADVAAGRRERNDELVFTATPSHLPRSDMQRGRSLNRSSLKGISFRSASHPSRARRWHSGAGQPTSSI